MQRLQRKTSILEPAQSQRIFRGEGQECCGRNGGEVQMFQGGVDQQLHGQVQGVNVQETGV